MAVTPARSCPARQDHSPVHAPVQGTPRQDQQGGSKHPAERAGPVGDRASTPAEGNQIGSSWSSAMPVRSILTLSTGYQHLQPRIITRSWPFHLLTATIDPSGQLTR